MDTILNHIPKELNYLDKQTKLMITANSAIKKLNPTPFFIFFTHHQ